MASPCLSTDNDCRRTFLDSVVRGLYEARLTCIDHNSEPERYGFDRHIRTGSICQSTRDRCTRITLETPLRPHLNGLDLLRHEHHIEIVVAWQARDNLSIHSAATLGVQKRPVASRVLN